MSNKFVGTYVVSGSQQRWSANEPITDLTITRAPPGDKISKLSDGDRLPLWIMREGAKRWRLAHPTGVFQKAPAIGVWSEALLKGARDGARGILLQGKGPSRSKGPPRRLRPKQSQYLQSNLH